MLVAEYSITPKILFSHCLENVSLTGKSERVTIFVCISGMLEFYPFYGHFLFTDTFTFIFDYIEGGLVKKINKKSQNDYMVEKMHRFISIYNKESR